MPSLFRCWRRNDCKNPTAKSASAQSAATSQEEQVAAVRAKVAEEFITGRGIEVGAGSRPFPIPAHATVLYGDIRDQASLEAYFKAAGIPSGKHIDGQSFAGIGDETLDFVISAHVIEHLRDPVGAIANAIRVLKPGGVHVLVVPEMQATFDRNRPETPLEHVMADFRDGGEGTCRVAYEEHLRYVHPYLTGQEYPEAEIQRQADESAKRWRECDIHFHAWTRSGFEALLATVSLIAPFQVVHGVSVVNETVFVLRKLAGTPK